MSRIGKKPVVVPAGVTAKVDGQLVSVKGAKGQLEFLVPDVVSVVHQDNEVGAVNPHFRTETVRHFKTEIVIFDVGADFRVMLGDAAKFTFPIAVEDDPIQMAFGRRADGFPAIKF